MTCEALNDLLLTDDDASGVFALDQLFANLAGSLIRPEDIDGDFGAELSDLRLP